MIRLPNDAETKPQSKGTFTSNRWASKAEKADGLRWYDAMLELYPKDLMHEHHRWDVQQEKGMPPWMAWAKGVPLPSSEQRLLERLAP